MQLTRNEKLFSQKAVQTITKAIIAVKQFGVDYDISKHDVHVVLSHSLKTLGGLQDYDIDMDALSRFDDKTDNDNVIEYD